MGRRLVLTCRHVIFDDQGRLWPRLEVWLGHPADGPRRRVAAQVAWTHPDGIPICGRASQEVTCEVCGRDVSADVARRGETGPYGRTADVCSVQCARAASAGEDRE